MRQSSPYDVIGSMTRTYLSELTVARAGQRGGHEGPPLVINFMTLFSDSGATWRRFGSFTRMTYTKLHQAATRRIVTAASGSEYWQF